MLQKFEKVNVKRRPDRQTPAIKKKRFFSHHINFTFELKCKKKNCYSFPLTY